MYQIFSSLIQSGTFKTETGIPRLRLPNAKLRKPEPIEADFSSLKEWTEISELMPHKAFFEYKWGTVSIDGSHIIVNPTEPGEYVIPIPLSTAGRTDVVFVQLTVNPNPDILLQKEIDPPDPDNAPYWKEKEYVDSLTTEFLSGHILGVSRRGQDHAINGTFRDDDFRIGSISGKGIYFIAVADGAGSAKYARKGSEIAVSIAIERMPTFLDDSCWEPDAFNATGKMGIALSRVAWESYDAIREEVTDKNSDHSVGDVTIHDYNTTLLLAAVKILPDGGLQIASFSIGDGAIAWLGENQFFLLSQPDSGEYSSETYFLTTESVWKVAHTEPEAFLKARVKVLSIEDEQAKQGSLMLMTDGVSDPFFPVPSDLSNPETWKDFLEKEIRGSAQISRDERPSKEVEKRLLSWINFRKIGHFDDRTFVLFELSSTQIKNQEEKLVNASRIADSIEKTTIQMAERSEENLACMHEEELKEQTTVGIDSFPDNRYKQGYFDKIVGGIKKVASTFKGVEKKHGSNTSEGGKDNE